MVLWYDEQDDLSLLTNVSSDIIRVNNCFMEIPNWFMKLLEVNINIIYGVSGWVI